MRILLISAKQNESNSLARALAKYGHSVIVSGASLGGKRGLKRLREATRIAFNEASQTHLIILDGDCCDRTIALTAHIARRIPLVLYFKGYFPTEYAEYLRGIWARVKWFEMNCLLKRCAHIVYVSRWLQDRYLDSPQLGMLRNKPSSVIHLGPDPFFHPANMHRGSLEDAEITLCYAGVFSYFDKARGVLLLLDAYSEILKTFKDIRLYICGDGRYRHLLQKRARDLNMGDKVVFTGRIEPEELSKYYRRADIFVYPSFLDGCPKAVLDAQACGIPTVVTHGSGAAELVVDGISGVVCQPAVEKLADSIVYLIQNPDIRHSMAIQAVEHVQRDLSWQVAASRFNEVIASLGHLSNRRE